MKPLKNGWKDKTLNNMDLNGCKLIGEGIWLPKDVIKKEMKNLRDAGNTNTSQYNMLLELLEAIETGL